MSNDNALFEDEFEMEFEDDFDSALATVLDEGAEIEDVDLDPPMKELDEFESADPLQEPAPIVYSDHEKVDIVPSQRFRQLHFVRRAEPRS